MSAYTIHNLKDISSEYFRLYIDSAINKIDPLLEGYLENEIDKQRDLSIKFHWGHDHDFGNFKMTGRMGNRHIDLMKNFCQFFPINLHKFYNKYVLDVGCWTGGTTLLLHSLGSKILALEEVKKYADMTLFLVKAFGLDDQIKVIPQSLYTWNYQNYCNEFDIIYFPGVIYHLTDPIIALRILYNVCKVGGCILVESMGIDVPEPYLYFEGTNITHGGKKEDLNRSGWNYFIPSASALHRMLEQVGFEKISTIYFNNRVYGYAEKNSPVAITRAGLSVPEIQ